MTEQFTKGEFEWDVEAHPQTGKFVKSLYTNQHKFQCMVSHASVNLPDQESDTKRVLPTGADFVIEGVRTEYPPLFTAALNERFIAPPT